MTDSKAPLPTVWLFSDEPVENGYTAKTKILITAIIVVALIVSFVSFLYFYVLYALHRRNPNGQRRPVINIFGFSAVAVEGEPPSSGLDPSGIAALRTFEYRDIEKKGDVEAGGAAEIECAICLSAVEEGEKVRQLTGCKHLFHTGCIDKWLRSRSTCPMCRMMVKPQSSVDAPDVGELSTAPERPRLVLRGEWSTGVRNQANLREDPERQ